jgi:hypothetical protein
VSGVRALRRRSRPSLFARIRTFWVVALLVLVVVGALFAAFANIPQLRVQSIEVSLPAAAPVAKDAVLAAAAIARDANVALLDTGAIRRRVEAIPYAGEVRLHRGILPVPSVRLEVGVRRPSACVAGNRTTVTIDASARVLQNGCVAGVLPIILAGSIDLPAPGGRLAGPDFNGLLADAATVAARLPVRTVGRDRFGGIEAVDRTGVTIRLGADGDLEAKLALVEPIRAAVARGRRIRAIDLRAPGTPTVEFP